MQPDDQEIEELLGIYRQHPNKSLTLKDLEGQRPYVAALMIMRATPAVVAFVKRYSDLEHAFSSSSFRLVWKMWLIGMLYRMRWTMRLEDRIDEFLFSKRPETFNEDRTLNAMLKAYGLHNIKEIIIRFNSVVDKLVQDFICQKGESNGKETESNSIKTPYQGDSLSRGDSPSIETSNGPSVCDSLD